MAVAAAAGPPRVQQVLTEIQSALQTTVDKQRNLLKDARKQHSHSDLLLPPDLTRHILVEESKALATHIDSVIGAAFAAQPGTESKQHASEQSTGPTTEAAAIRDIVRLEQMGSFVRKLVLVDVLDKTDTSELQGASETKEFYDRLDIVLSLDICGLTENGLALSIHQDILERLSVAACGRHFDYIESRVKDLTQGLVPSKGKGLVLLRMCNEQLRRLSKPNSSHTVFAGRILTFLSSVFPLGERSGVNLRGDFNVDNKTLVEPPVEAGKDEQDVEEDRPEQGEIDDAEEDEDKKPKQRRDAAKHSAIQAKKRDDESMLAFAGSREFYEIFWGTQQFFSNPAFIVQEKSTPMAEFALPDNVVDPVPEGAKGRMQIFRRVTRRIFDIFAAVQRREKELAGQMAAEESKFGKQTSKRATDSLPNAGEDFALKKRRRTGTETEREQSMHSGDSDGFFPKYLTGRNLLEYELRDASFRRHVLVQYLILFQYLLCFTPTNREKAKTWKNAALAHSMSYSLDESDDRWLREVWRETLNLIRDTSSEGRNYALSVLQILRHEARWINWKTETCPSIDKNSMSESQAKAFAEGRKAVNRSLRAYPFALGTAALTRLWEDGVKPPEPSMRTIEDENGMEIQVQTDGLDELEMGPQIASLASYASQIRKIEEEQQERRKELDWDQSRTYVITPQIPLAVRQQERTRIVREKDDGKLAALEQRRTVAAWRALRLARAAHLDLFGKIQCKSTTSAGGIAVGMRIDDISGLMESVDKQAKGIPIVAVAPAPAIVKKEGSAEMETAPSNLERKDTPKETTAAAATPGSTGLDEGIVHKDGDADPVADDPLVSDRDDVKPEASPSNDAIPHDAEAEGKGRTAGFKQDDMSAAQEETRTDDVTMEDARVEQNES